VQELTKKGIEESKKVAEGDTNLPEGDTNLPEGDTNLPEGLRTSKPSRGSKNLQEGSGASYTGST
jgi:hypothetical protein